MVWPGGVAFVGFPSAGVGDGVSVADTRDVGDGSKVAVGGALVASPGSVPPDNLVLVGVGVSSESGIEVDVTRGYLYFKAGNQHLWWYLAGSVAERVKLAALAGSKLERCRGIEVSWTRDRPTKSNCIVFNFATDLVIKMHPPSN